MRRAPLRLAVGVGQLVVVAVVVFFLTTSLPGDTAEIVLGQDATPEQVAALRAQLGTDRPAGERFADWASGVLAGDLGRSLQTGQPVVTELSTRLGSTALLAALTLLLLLPLAVLAGTAAGRRAGSSLDRGLTGFLSSVQAAPEFALGLLLVALFALQLGWVPATGGGGGLVTPAVLVLPVVVLVANQLGRLARQVRAGVLTVDRAPHVVHLRRLGLPEPVVLARHVLPGAVLPTIQQLARVVDGLLGGVVVVESLFALPGIGSGFVEAVRARDLPLVGGYALLFAATTILVNLAAGLLSARLTPYRAVLT
ncbi:ABC transporter permease [Actinomycetospora sp. OC33-EN08]|uniref:ABC transporter permease n=1 Tax=Actinomycetospora aurantiaca TaxID=3129233 RepID=A0ABU8ML84_9PSEU